jgi:hypothetical protein
MCGSKADPQRQRRQRQQQRQQQRRRSSSWTALDETDVPSKAMEQGRVRHQRLARDNNKLLKKNMVVAAAGNKTNQTEFYW